MKTIGNIKFRLKRNLKGFVEFYIIGRTYKLHDITTKKIALSIIEDGGEITISDKIKGFPLCVDSKYYFKSTVKKCKSSEV